MAAGVIRIVREDEKGRSVYRYQCQKCHRITESRNRERKLCWHPVEDVTDEC